MAVVMMGTGGRSKLQRVSPPETALAPIRRINSVYVFKSTARKTKGGNVKMARGGYRPGAGRPKGSKAKSKTAIIKGDAYSGCLTPLEFLLKVMRDDALDIDIRVRAASLALPYCHTRKGEVSGRDDVKARAEKAATGKFGPGKPPLKIVPKSEE